mmetsp:Transcript_7219/g.15499  ORF Transcript_7219/g.15499 Transcript_7219/m.15499 type:complete len:139 (-) Transcript_7219:4136-4552(-)
MKINNSHHFFLLAGFGTISCLTNPTDGFSSSVSAGASSSRVRPAWTSERRRRVGTTTRTATALRDSAENDPIDNTQRLETLAKIANEALSSHGTEIFKPFHARVAVIPPSNDDDDDDYGCCNHCVGNDAKKFERAISL